MLSGADMLWSLRAGGGGQAATHASHLDAPLDGPPSARARLMTFVSA